MVKAIPSILTFANLTSGVMAILLMDLFWSPLLILLGALFDLFDGATARWLKAESEFGKELDSLCDLVSFGVAPACLFWLIVPTESWYLAMAPMIISIAGAARLAKFNLLPASKDFTGLPIPANAIFIVGIALGIYYGQPLISTIVGNPISYLLIAVFLSYAMVSSMPMFSLKGIKKDKVWILLLVVLTIVVGILDFRLMIPAGVVIYILLSFIRRLA